MTHSPRPPILFAARWLLVLILLLSACHADTPVSVDVDVDLDHDALRVTTATDGSSVDPDGYRVSITGPGTRIEDSFDPNDTRVYTLVFNGLYRIELRDLDASCRTERPVRELELEVGVHHSVLFRVRSLGP